MNRSAVLHVPVKRRLIALVALLAAAVALLSIGGSASAARIGKDGKIHACYRVKGKPKGMLRIVQSAKAHCRRGERKVAWALAGPASLPGGAGQAGGSGSAGQSGQAGTGGQTGASGASGPGVSVDTQVAALTLKLEGLEEVLAGVTHGELTGALSTLDGIDNGELTGALAKLNGISGQNLDDLVSQLPTLEGVPALQGNVTQLGGEVETICQQTNSVNDQVGAVGDVVNNLLSGLDAIPLVGDVLGGETVTGGVSNLTC